MFGLDYTNESVQVVKQMDAKFVCRYVGYFSGYNLNTINVQQGKCLYTGEANALLADGIDIVSNFEWYAMRPSIHDSGSSTGAFAAGQWDARVANAIHLGCGGPSTAPIYFSVDYQTDGTDTIDYFEGVASVIGLPRVGAYGGFDCIKFLFDRGLISYGWQTYAWSKGQWDTRAHIHQYSNGNKTVDGGEVDFNDSVKSNYGSWRMHMAGIPDGWTDDGTILTARNGIQINTGFRSFIMSQPWWYGENIPLAPEHEADPVSIATPDITGTRIDFVYCSLIWRRVQNVVVFADLNAEAAILIKQISTSTGDAKAEAAKVALQAWLAG